MGDTRIGGGTADNPPNSLVSGLSGVSENRIGDTFRREKCAIAERAGMGLAEAMAVGGEAAARLVWRIAVGRP
jgi:hypothetical protein